MRQTDWQHLPCAGGLLDQPEALMEDLKTLSWREAKLKDMLTKQPGEDFVPVRRAKRDDNLPTDGR